MAAREETAKERGKRKRKNCLKGNYKYFLLAIDKYKMRTVILFVVDITL